jgi:hypothetical protein
VRDRATSGLATVSAAAARGGADASVAERDLVRVERTAQEILAAVGASGALRARPRPGHGRAGRVQEATSRAPANSAAAPIVAAADADEALA